MLIHIFPFSLFIAIIWATGEFTVLHSPKSIEFSGNDALESFYVGDVLLAALGNAVTGNTKWSGLSIKDPFSLSKTTLIIVHFQGAFRVPTIEKQNVYELTDSDTKKSLDNLVAQLRPDSVSEFNFLNHSIGVKAFQSHFGNIDVPMAMPLKNFKPLEYLSHQHFLEEIGYMKAIAENITSLLQPSQVIIIRISLLRITKVAKYAILHEAKQMITEAVNQLLSAAKNGTDSLLFVQTTDKLLSTEASMREVAASNTSNPFEKFNDFDYPIIFNIVVWFSLAFALSLAVICYIIANIDPGRDSVIYRISSTQTMIKKKH